LATGYGSKGAQFFYPKGEQKNFGGKRERKREREREQ